MIFAVVAVLLAIAGIYHNANLKRNSEFADIPTWKLLGFVAEGQPDESASSVQVTFNEDGRIYFDVFLSWNEKDRLKVICDEKVALTLEGTEYHSGDLISVPPLTELAGSISATGADSVDGIFRFVGTGDIPSAHIGLYEDNEAYLAETKGNTATGFCTILDELGQQAFLGNCSVRIHGNTSWYNEKKSYQLTLEEDAGFLGMSPQRKWLLISEFVDSSFMKDAIMYRLAKNTGDEYSPEFCFANVYLDGAYKGLYLFVQKIGIEGGTLDDLKDLEQENAILNGDAISQNITGGYLVELGVLESMTRDEGDAVFESPKRYMRVKAPNNITDDQLTYLSELVDEAEEALYLDDGFTTTAGRTWADYFDKMSWIRQYLLQEISANYDTEYASEFFYVRENERVLYGGPGWDFDRSLTDYIHFIQNESLNYNIRALHNNAIRVFEKDESGVLWLRQLDSHEDFHSGMNEFFYEEAEPELRKILEEDVPVWQEQIAGSVATDAMLWRGLELSLEERDHARSEFASTKPEVVVALADRLSFLHEYYAHEEDYSFVTFTIPESRFDLVIPVLTGQTIGEEVLPFYKDSMDWYDGEELFSTDTVITKDIVLVQKE